jgi:nucleotide-binding universal stress UspA family protein
VPGILVGVDGSERSLQAVRWAMREAVQRHLPLTVMTVHPDPVRPVTGVYWGLRSYPENSFDPDLVRAAVQEFVDKVTSEIGGTMPEVTVNVATGEPAEELIRASRDADLLVVGSRGGGGFGRLLMGSVSTQVTHHAECPVVIIPGANRGL